MQVSLNMDDVKITLGNNGISLAIADNQGRHVGDLRIGKATVEWMQGRTREGNGIRVRLQDLIAMIEDLVED